LQVSVRDGKLIGHSFYDDDLDFDLIGNEERYRSVGLTNGGRLLSVVWTIRKGKVRAITAFPASVSDRKAFREGTK